MTASRENRDRFSCFGLISCRVVSTREETAKCRLMGESQLCRATHSGGSSREPSQLPGPQLPASPSPPEVLQLPSSEVPWKAQVPPTPAAICSPTPTVRAVMLTLAYLRAALAVGPRSLPSLLPAWRGPLPAVLVFSLWHGDVVLEEWCHCTDCVRLST